MHGMLCLPLSASLGCFCPRTSLWKTKTKTKCNNNPPPPPPTTKTKTKTKAKTKNKNKRTDWTICHGPPVSDLHTKLRIISRCVSSLATDSPYGAGGHSWTTCLLCGGPISRWRHQMETLSALLPFVRGIHRSPVNSPHKGQWRGALMFSLICTRINSWVNNNATGDLRRHHAHYDVIVMFRFIFLNDSCCVNLIWRRGISYWFFTFIFISYMAQV